MIDYDVKVLNTLSGELITEVIEITDWEAGTYWLWNLDTINQIILWSPLIEMN